MVARPVLFYEQERSLQMGEKRGILPPTGFHTLSKRREILRSFSQSEKIGCSLNKKWRKIEHEKTLYP